MHQRRREQASQRDEVLRGTPAQMREQFAARSAAASDPGLARVRAIVARHASEPGPLLPTLHEVQDELGCIPADAIGAIAEGLNLSRAEVHGVVTYYHHFRRTAPGRHVLEICRAESCQAMGGEALWRQACEALGLPPQGGTTGDGSVTLQPVYCLGLCAASPGGMLDEHPHARLDAQRLRALLEKARAAAEDAA